MPSKRGTLAEKIGTVPPKQGCLTLPMTHYSVLHPETKEPMTMTYLVLVHLSGKLFQGVFWQDNAHPLKVIDKKKSLTTTITINLQQILRYGVQKTQNEIYMITLVKCMRWFGEL